MTTGSIAGSGRLDSRGLLPRTFGAIRQLTTAYGRFEVECGSVSRGIGALFVGLAAGGTVQLPSVSKRVSSWRRWDYLLARQRDLRLS